MATEIATHSAWYAENIKALAGSAAAVIAALGAWWAWKTSLLTKMQDRITALEARVESMQLERAQDVLRIAELTGENIALREALKQSQEREAEWKRYYQSRRERHIQDTSPGLGEHLDTVDDHDAADRLAADSADDLPSAP